MSNKVFKEYMEKENNIDLNYKKIMSKTNEKKKILNIAAAVMVITILGIITGSNYAKRSYNIDYREFETNEEKWCGVERSNENGYTEKIDMDYVYKDDIGVKINSLFMTDDFFETKVDIKLPKNLQIHSDTISYGYAIYDENPENKIYSFSERLPTEYNYDITDFYKEVGTKYNRFDIFVSQYSLEGGREITKITKGNILSNISLHSREGFPKSKKIYIKIFDIGYYMSNSDGLENDFQTEDFNLSGKNEWLFEIDVPERMYNRKTINLKLEHDIPEVNFDKFTVSESKMYLYVYMDNSEISEKLDNINLRNYDEEARKIIGERIHITDENDNIYYRSDYGGYGLDYMDAKFDIDKYNLKEHEFFLNININGKYYKEKIIVAD